MPHQNRTARSPGVVLPVVVVLVLLHAHDGFHSPAAALDPAPRPIGTNDLWGSEFHPPDLYNRAWSATAGGLIQLGGELVAVGDFSHADGRPLGRIARWDGSSWQPWPQDLPESGCWSSPVLYKDHLVTAARSSLYASEDSLRVLEWGGSSWTRLGGAMDRGGARALIEYAGDLVVAGRFTRIGDCASANVARWDGTRWHALGTGLPGSEVEALAVYQGELYAAGEMTLDSLDTHLARWTGTSWQPVATVMGGGWAPGIRSLLVWNGELLAGGWFSEISGVHADGVAAWDGTSWRAPGRIPAPYLLCIYALLPWEDGIIAAGAYPGIDSSDPSIWRYDGLAWRDMDEDGLGDGSTDQHGCVTSLLGYDNDLIIAGTFSGKDHLLGGIARWDGVTWTSLGRSAGAVGSEVRILLPGEAGLFAGGWFKAAGTSPPVDGVALWDGTQWHPLGGGIASAAGSHKAPYVCSMALYNGRLVAGGGFDSAGTVPARNIARWDGFSWSALGNREGGASGADSSVLALKVWNGRLYAGGAFAHIGGISAKGIACWDGTEWSPVGSGIRGGEEYVTDLEVYGGDLYAAGSFQKAGEADARRIARWDGTAWHAVGIGFAFPLGRTQDTDHLAVWDSRLVSPGHVLTGGSWSDVGLYTWDGIQWSLLDPNPTDVRAIGVYQGHLIVCGTFPFGTDGTTVRALSAWEDGRWAPIQGAPEDVSAILPWEGQLYVGGSFAEAGGTASLNLARWDGRFLLSSPSRQAPLRIDGTFLGESGIRLRFSLAEPTEVSLGIYNLQGRRVASLAGGVEGRGERVHLWDGYDSQGRRVPSGVYFARLSAGAQGGTGRITVIW